MAVGWVTITNSNCAKVEEFRRHIRIRQEFVRLTIVPINELDNDEHRGRPQGLRKESGTSRPAFQGFDKFEPGRRVIGCTIGVYGREKAGMVFLWDVAGPREIGSKLLGDVYLCQGREEF